MEILGLLNQQLVKLLETVMPALDSDWWNSLVKAEIGGAWITSGSAVAWAFVFKLQSHRHTGCEAGPESHGA